MTTTKQLPFYQVDVFSSEPYKGNPVAVTIIEDETLANQLRDGDHMARFARWTNLSETTFILPVTEKDEPEVDYNLRIFTPGIELPFAGHPTLGSCRAWLEHGGKPKRSGKVVQKCGLGLIEIRISDDGQILSFSTPPLRKSGPATSQEIQPFLKAMNLSENDVLESQWIVNGPEWCALRLRDANQVLNVDVSNPTAAGKGIWGIFGSYQPGQHPDGATFEVRTFAPGDGISEDPVTGSFSAGLGEWFRNAKPSEAMQDDKLSFIVAQGTCLDRSGRLYIKQEDDGKIWVGGRTLVCVKGNVLLP